MLQFLTIIKTIIAILPILRDLITASEAFFPAQGSGVQKLELVRVLLQNTYETAVKVETPFASIWPTISNLIGFAVPTVTARTATVAAQVKPAVPVTVPSATLDVQLSAPNA